MEDLCRVRALTRVSRIKATHIERLRKRCPLVSTTSSFFPGEAEALALAVKLGSSNENEQANAERFEEVLKPCQERPQSLDISLEQLTNSLIPRVASPHVSRALYLLCKIRGRKAVARTLPREVFRLHEALELIDSKDCWETRYVGLVWLSILVLVPFAIDSILDSDQPIRDIIARCESFIRESKPTREPGSLCLARLLTRPDSTSELREFINREADNIGVLLTKAEIFKRGSGSVEIKNIATESLRDRVIPECEKVFLNPNKYSSLERKLHLKILQRVFGASQMQDPRLIESLVGLLVGSGLSDNDSIVRWSAAKGIARVCEKLAFNVDLQSQVCDSVLSVFANENEDGYEDDSLWHGASLALAELARKRLLRKPDQIHQALSDCVAKALEFDRKRGTRTLGSNVRDAACYVCWALVRNASADHIGVHSERIYRDLVITALFDREVTCRRAAAAALQECVGRLGRSRFPKGIETIQIVDYQNIGNLQRSYTEYACRVGALANSENIQEELCKHLVDIRSRHWDEQIRKLSSIALASLSRDMNTQICWVWFNTLSKRILLTSSSQQVNRYDLHGAILGCAELIPVLFERQKHRETDNSLDSQIHTELGRLVRNACKHDLPFEDYQQACCRLLEAAALHGILTDSDRMDYADKFVLNALYISAPCSLTSAATSTGPRSTLLSVSMPPAKEQLRIQARSALVAFFTSVPLKFESPSKIEQWIACPLTNPVFVGIEAYLVHAILSSMTTVLKNKETSQPQLQPHHLVICERLVEMLKSKTNPYQDRVECLQALAELSIFAEELAFRHVLAGFSDYQTTNQGDVGSWVRRQACETVVRILNLRENPLHPPTSTRLPDDLLDQAQYHCAFLACEKLDHVREKALEATITMLRLYDRKQANGDKFDTMNFLQQYVSSSSIGARPEGVDIDNREQHSNPSTNVLGLKESFELCGQILDNVPKLQRPIIKGLALTAGSLSESPSGAAKHCLFRFALEQYKKDQFVDAKSTELRQMWDTLLDAVKTDGRQESRIVPLLKTIASLMLDSPVSFLPKQKRLDVQEKDQLSSVVSTSPFDLWATEMMDQVFKVTEATKSVARLVAGGRVLIGIGAAGYFRAWKDLTRFIVHPFPIVRKQTYEAIYLWGVGILDPSESEFEHGGGSLDSLLEVVANAMNMIDDEHLDENVLAGFKQEFQLACPHT